MESSDEEVAEEKPLEFTQVESEEFWDQIGYNPGEVREMNGGPIKLQNADLMPRLDQFLKSDAAGSDQLVLNSQNEI